MTQGKSRSTTAPGPDPAGPGPPRRKVSESLQGHAHVPPRDESAPRGKDRAAEAAERLSATIGRPRQPAPAARRELRGAETPSADSNAVPRKPRRRSRPSCKPAANSHPAEALPALRRNNTAPPAPEPRAPAHNAHWPATRPVPPAMHRWPESSARSDVMSDPAHSQATHKSHAPPSRPLLRPISICPLSNHPTQTSARLPHTPAPEPRRGSAQRVRMPGTNVRAHTGFVCSSLDHTDHTR